MSATFITQEQFDEIDACMKFMAKCDIKMNHFIDALSEYQNLKPSLPSSAVLEGIKRGNYWRPPPLISYNTSVGLGLGHALRLANYLVRQLSALPRTELKLPAVLLPELVPPPKPPMIHYLPKADCLELLVISQTSVASSRIRSEYAEEACRSVREGIYQVMPRLIDFTSAVIENIETKPRVPGKMAALTIAENIRDHYILGMNGTANLGSQQNRITLLLKEAASNLGMPEADHNLARLKNELDLALIGLNKAHSCWKKIMTLHSL